MKEDIESENCLTCLNISSCFKVLDSDQLLATNQNRVTLKFKKGDVIAKQGTFATHLMFIKSGLVKLFREGDTGQNGLIINIFTSGNIIGLSSLYGDSTFNYTVAAIEDSTLCLIEINTIRKLIPTNGEFAVAVITKLSKNNLLAYDLLYNITHKQLNGRMATALLFLAKDVYHSIRFKLSLSRKDLAEFTGMSVMSVVRVIKEFKETGVINNDNGTIEILDIERLKRISEFG